MARVDGKKLSITEVGGNKIDLQGQCANSMSREKHESYGIQENPKGTLSGASITVESNCPGSREKWVYELSLDRKRNRNELRYEFTGGTELINCRYQESTK